MEKRKALIFDMDGTMFDTEPISYRFWREISARYGYDLDRTVFDQMLGVMTFASNPFAKLLSDQTILMKRSSRKKWRRRWNITKVMTFLSNRA